MGQSNFDRTQTLYEIPKLNSLQESAYRKFLQADVAPASRTNSGLERIFRETFPIKSHDGKITLRVR